jgi:PAS domain-containing protein
MTAQQVGGWACFRQLNGDAAKADLVTTDFIDILDTIDVPIVVIGRNFIIASFNRAAAEALRLEPSDIGRSPRDNLMLVGLAQLEEWCAQVMATGGAPRKGFGSRLIEASLKNAQVLFAPEGITCTLEVSL